MTTVLLLQSASRRDVGDDAALVALARELSPASVVAAVDDPDRTGRTTGLDTVAAHGTSVLRQIPASDALVVLGPVLGDRTGDSGTSVPALLSAYRMAGRTVAVLGLGAEAMAGRRARQARSLVVGSSLTTVDSPASVRHLVAAGLPEPLRVGADPAWLELREPPRLRPVPSRADRPGDRPVHVVIGGDEVAAHGGAGPVAARLAAVLAATRAVDLVVQAWHPGTSAGADLDAGHAVVEELARTGVVARLLPPPTSLGELRDLVAEASLVVCAAPHALMAAAASGVPVLAWPYDEPSRSAAERLQVPVLTGGDPTPGYREARAAAGPVLAEVRREMATAGDVVDLLRLLLTGGAEAPAAPRAPVADDTTTGLRPTGVMR